MSRTATRGFTRSLRVPCRLDLGCSEKVSLRAGGGAIESAWRKPRPSTANDSPAAGSIRARWCHGLLLIGAATSGRLRHFARLLNTRVAQNAPRAVGTLAALCGNAEFVLQFFKARDTRRRRSSNLLIRNRRADADIHRCCSSSSVALGIILIYIHDSVKSSEWRVRGRNTRAPPAFQL